MKKCVPPKPAANTEDNCGFRILDFGFVFELRLNPKSAIILRLACFQMSRAFAFSKIFLKKIAKNRKNVKQNLEKAFNYNFFFNEAAKSPLVTRLRMAKRR
jgi:hypothetical protein